GAVIAGTVGVIACFALFYIFTSSPSASVSSLSVSSLVSSFASAYSAAVYFSISILLGCAQQLATTVQLSRINYTTLTYYITYSIITKKECI
ncbi:MAG: hypothetical protein WCJ17_01840, partial [bacterium]